MMAAVAAAAISCSESFETTESPEGTTTTSTPTSTITVSVSEDETRVAADDTSADEWTFKWKSGDTLIAYETWSGAKTLSMTDDGFNENASTFDSSGLTSGKDYKIFHGDNSSGSNTNYLYLYLNAQNENLNSIPLMGDGTITKDGDTTLDMKHLGAFMRLNATFDSSMYDYTLTKIVLPNVPNRVYMGGTSDYESLLTSTGSVIVTLENPIAIDGSKVTIPFSILPFTVASGSSMSLYLYFEDSDNNEYCIISTKSPDDYDSMASFEFARATVNDYSVACKASDFAVGFNGGEGTETNPYLISSADDLAELSVFVAAGDTFLGKYFKMTDDIELNGSESNQFTAIGSSSVYFRGTFDGDGHTVSGLYINTSSTRQGLFGYTYGATIKNLGVSGSVTSTNNYVGGVVGQANKGTTIVNCFSDVTVQGSSNVGGVVGYASGATIANCYNLGSVKATSDTGGIVAGVVGVASGSTMFGTTTLAACYNVGTLTGSTIRGVYSTSTSNYVSASACYYLSGCGTTSIIGGTIKEDDYMKSSDFVDDLNTAAAAYNSTADDAVKACKWVDNSTSGYPTLNFGTVATAE